MKDFPYLTLLGFLGFFISNNAAFLGTHLSTSQIAALLATTPPVFTVFLAVMILKEILTTRKVLAVFLALFGVFLVVGNDYQYQKEHLLGVAILIAAAIGWSLYTIYLKKSILSALATTTYAIGFGFLFTLPITVLTFETSDILYLTNLSVWLAILFLGIIATGFAFYLWNKGLQYVDASIGSLFTFFNDVAGGFLGWLILNEELTWNFLLGVVVILTATILVLFKDIENLKEKRET